MKKCGYHSMGQRQDLGLTFRKNHQKTCGQTKKQKKGNLNDYMAMREECNEDVIGGKIVMCEKM